MIRIPKITAALFALGATAFAAGGSNLITPVPSAWHQWSPRPGLAPALAIKETGSGLELSGRSTSFPQYGEWYTLVKGIRAGTYYRFDALHRAESIGNEGLSIAAMLSWCRKDCTEDAIQRDYIDRQAEAGAWRRDFRVLRAPEGTQAVKVELILRWSANGSVVWKDVSLTQTDPPQPRTIRVATTHLTPPIPSSVEANLKMMGSMLDKAGAEKADIVCLSENVVGRGVNLPVPDRARAVAAPTMKLLAEKAKRYRMYVVTTFEEPDGEVVYNTAVLFDREGKLAAKYRKMHLPLAEAEMGYTPGGEYAVVDTDFGRLGILICWDYWFPETARILRLKGADLLLLPIAGDGKVHWDHTLKARAMDNGVYIAASAVGVETVSRIVNPAGEVLAETSGEYGFAVTNIDLNQEFRTPWLSVGPGLGEGKSLAIKERRSDTFAPLIN